MKQLIKRIRNKWSIKMVVGLCFGFALIISFISSVISYNSTTQVLESANELSHSHIVYGLLKDVIADVSLAESFERGYVITGKDEYLINCNALITKVHHKLNTLNIITQNDTIRQAMLEILEPMVKTRVMLMKEILTERQKRGYDSALELVLSHRPQIMMNSIRNIIGHMEESENEMMQRGTSQARVFSDRIKNIIILGNIITIVVLASCMVVIFIDITQRNYFEQELIKAKEIAEKSVEVKENFLANVSHEIRTPMNAISGLTKILLKTNLNEKQKDYIDAIKTSSDILLVLINDILDLTKAQSGKMVFERADFNLSRLIFSVSDLFQSKVEEKNLKFSVNLDEKVPESLIGDAVRLNQILLNLISNAIKFTEHGEIRVASKLLQESESYVIIEFKVMDTGIGIPKDKINTIFESFTQASTEITRKYGGTGLGLNIVKQLVELQGGNISITSTPKKGSEFSFSLTFEKSHKQFAEKEKRDIAFSIPFNRAVKVLLVEDNHINQLVAKTVLNDFGFITHVAASGKQALEKVRKEKYDVILMDIQMPDMSGYETTYHIRQMPEPHKSIPIIAMTANAGKVYQEKCLKAGMDDYISKPFNEYSLYRKICKQLKLELMEEEAKPLTNQDFKLTNLDYLRTVSKGNTKFMAEVISIFMLQTPSAITNMKKYAHAGDWKSLAAEAHKIKPSFNFMGMKKTGDLAKEIEELGKNNVQTEKIVFSIEKIEDACSKAFPELEMELKKLM
jgi:signal transduction histidine kinase/DNA-binding NarL/FixJ family response regulator